MTSVGFEILSIQKHQEVQGSTVKAGGATARRELFQEIIQTLFLNDLKKPPQLASLHDSFSLSITVDTGRKERLGKWRRGGGELLP